MRALIQQGAGASAADDGGWTPLMFAATSGKIESVKLLLPLVDPAQKTRAKATPLMLFSAAGWAEGTALLLAALDRLSTGKDRGARAPAQFAAGRRDNHGRTSLILAAQAACADCVRLLLPLSNPNAADMDGRTALMWAAVATDGDVEGCLSELALVGDATKRDKRGRTALHLAASSGQPEAVERLADLIDPLICDDEGKTSFDASGDRLDADGERIRQTLRRAIAERERREIHVATSELGAFATHSRRPLAL